MPTPPDSPDDNAKNRLKVGTVYTGKVAAVTTNGVYAVVVDSPAQTVAGVVLASSIISGMLGFHDSRVLPAGTPVGMVYGNPSFVFAVFPASPPDEANGSGRSVSWGDAVSDVPGAGQFGSSHAPDDMVAGEFDFDNLFGVGLRFLTSMIAMKAGDRAKVECHLLNDMVRIVSQQFRHIHGLGEELIFDHGRPMLERGYSSYRHELMGLMKESDPLFEMDGDSIDKSKIDRVGAQARHRYLEYLGFMGDFIHRFVCDPPATLVGMVEATADSGKRAGKAWEHFGSDGSYVLQSTSEIRFERVTRIPVPYRKASHEDPAVTRDRKYRELSADFIKAWDYGSYATKDAYRTAYQLRLYARWLTRFQAFARALQLDKEFGIPTESGSPAPDWNNAEEDRRTANPDLEYFESYSCYCILRDGSQVIHDGYGSSAVFSNGNVQLSAARHLDLEAAGDIRMVCSSFFLKARRHIEMSASAGGIVMHSYAFLRALCERGSIHLRSDAKIIGAEAPAKVGVAPPIPPVVLDSAILLESTEGRFAVRSEKQISLTVEGAAGDAEDRSEDTADIVLSARGSVRVRASKYVIIGAARDLITSSRHWATKVSKWYGDVGDILWDKFYMSPKSGRLQVERLDAGFLQVQHNIAGPERGPVPPQNSRVPVGPHTNHISLRVRDIEFKYEATPDVNARASLDFAPAAKTVAVSPWDKDAPDAKWEFLGDTDYYWDTREERRGALVQTLTQQYVTQDNPTLWGGSDHYDTWSWAGDYLMSAKRIGENKVGFGGKASQYVVVTGEDLHTSSTRGSGAWGSAAGERTWRTGSVVFKLLKHS